MAKGPRGNVSCVYQRAGQAKDLSARPPPNTHDWQCVTYRTHAGAATMGSCCRGDPSSRDARDVMIAGDSLDGGYEIYERILPFTVGGDAFLASLKGIGDRGAK